MNWNVWIRQGHRWLSIVFTLGFIANLFALGQQSVPGWVYALVLEPLFLLFASGLYLFMLPHLARSRRTRARE